MKSDDGPRDEARQVFCGFILLCATSENGEVGGCVETKNRLNMELLLSAKELSPQIARRVS
jgi:hypothetical protein